MHDSEVVASIAGDRSGGLSEAYDRYGDPLYKYCLAFLGEPAEAADAVRDAFIIAAVRLTDLREPYRLRAWLYAVAHNECQRITPPGRPVFATAQASYVMAGAADADDDAERARLRDLLDAATSGLTPGERELIELELRQGLAVAEVAAVVGVSRARANTLASRAREHLEAGLAAVVVARAGRRDCRVLSGMLDGWDGELTVPLREQVHQHIGRCATCSTRRDVELHPGRLFGQSPGEALAAAAAASLRVAAGPPDALRAHTLALAVGQDPDAVAHQAAVLGRAGAFDSRGFPKPAPGPKEAKEAPAGGDGGGPARRKRRIAVTAGLAAAAVIGVVAVALIDGSGHEKLAAGHLSSSRPPTGSPTAATFGASPGTSPTSSATRAAATATATPSGSATTAPQDTPSAANHATTPAATTNPTATSTAPTPTPTSKPATPGTLAVSPSGGALWVPPGGTTISLTAQGGPVTWSSTVSSGSGTVQLSPSGGTITAGATVTVTVTTSGSATGRTVTINPGGTAFTIFLALLALGARLGFPAAVSRKRRTTSNAVRRVPHAA
jgi:RNA polymerase sigma factor (sigma-70 family)